MTRTNLDEYYKNYYIDHGKDSYMMGTTGMTSRVLTLMDWIKKYTPENGTVLDIGCGDGHLSTLLPDYKWVGLDINTSQAQGKTIQAIDHDIMVAPYPIATGSIDTVVCSEVLEHVFDLRIVHKEAKRVLKREGTYIVSTPNYDWVDHFLAQYRQLLFDENKPHLFEHIRQYNFATHKRFLNMAGFGVIEHTGADGQYSGMHYPAMQVLAKELNIELGKADQIMGRMFPTWMHTIVLASKKV